MTTSPTYTFNITIFHNKKYIRLEEYTEGILTMVREVYCTVKTFETWQRFQQVKLQEFTTYTSGFPTVITHIDKAS